VTSGGAGAAGTAALEERLARAHPQVRPLLEGGDEPPPADVETARAGYRALTEARTGPREPVAQVRELDAGGVAVRVYVPALEEGDAGQTRGSEGGGLDQGAAALDPPVARTAQPAILFLHGGGWVVGDLDGVDHAEVGDGSLDLGVVDRGQRGHDLIGGGAAHDVPA